MSVYQKVVFRKKGKLLVPICEQNEHNVSNERNKQPIATGGEEPIPFCLIGGRRPTHGFVYTSTVLNMYMGFVTSVF